MRERPIEQVLAEFFSADRRDLNTSIPGFIESYDPETKTAQVKIPFSEYQKTGGNNLTNMDWAPLLDVPVVFPRGGGWAITLPLIKGDPVLVIFSQRELDQWFPTDGQTDVSPQLLTTHNESDAICIPGLFPQGNLTGEANATDLIMSHSDGDVLMRFEPGGAVRLTCATLHIGTQDAAKSLALTEKVDSRITSLQAKVDTLVTGANAAVAAGGLWLTPQTPLGALASVNSEAVFTND